MKCTCETDYEQRREEVICDAYTLTRSYFLFHSGDGDILGVSDGWGAESEILTNVAQLFLKQITMTFESFHSSHDDISLPTCSLARNSAAGSTSDAGGISNSSSKALMIVLDKFYLQQNCLLNSL